MKNIKSDGKYYAAAAIITAQVAVAVVSVASMFKKAK